MSKCAECACGRGFAYTRTAFETRKEVGVHVQLRAVDDGGPRLGHLIRAKRFRMPQFVSDHNARSGVHSIASATLALTLDSHDSGCTVLSHERNL